MKLSIKLSFLLLILAFAANAETGNKHCDKAFDQIDAANASLSLAGKKVTADGSIKNRCSFFRYPSRMVRVTALIIEKCHGHVPDDIIRRHVKLNAEWKSEYVKLAPWLQTNCSARR